MTLENTKMEQEQNYYNLLENAAHADQCLLENLHSTDNQNVANLEHEMAQNTAQQVDLNNNSLCDDTNR